MFSNKNSKEFKSRIQSNERKLNFGKLHFLYKDYDAAKKCVVEHLSKSPNCADGYKLLGQIQEAMGENAKALKSFQRSLEIDCSQDDLILTVCKLLAHNPTDVDLMQFWLDKAEKCCPNDEIILNLKAKLEDYDKEKRGTMLVDEHNIYNGNYSYNESPKLIMKNNSTKMNNSPKSRFSNEKIDEQLNNIVTCQQSMLKTICDNHNKLLICNTNILDAVKDVNKNFSNLQDKMDKIVDSLGSFSLKAPWKDSYYDYDQEQDTNDYYDYDEQGPDSGQRDTLPLQQLQPGIVQIQKKPLAVQNTNFQITTFEKNIKDKGPFTLDVSSGKTAHAFQIPLNASLATQSMFSFGVVNEQIFPDTKETINSTSSSAGTHKPHDQVFQKPETYWNCIVCSVSNTDMITSCSGCKTTRTQKPLHELFKQPENSWNCDICYVSNTEANVSCVACETPRPGSLMIGNNNQEKPNAVASTPFKFGIPFSNDPQKITTSASIVNTMFQPSTNFATSSVNADNQQISAFSFSSTINELQKPSAFKFGSNKDFDFQFSAADPINAENVSGNLEDCDKSIGVQESPDVSNDDSLHFKPVIPLPPTIEVRTGEEDERILFNERAKLFRFDNKEWKERGIGQIKLLHVPGAGRVRILMRRDQVLKVCLNHYVTEDLNLTPVGDASHSKSYRWSALDFSDGSPEAQVFAIRFKTSELADSFRKCFEESKKIIGLKDEEEENIQIVFENKSCPEDQKEAEKYKLPPNFYSYKLKPTCPGCFGCDDFMPRLLFEQQDSQDNQEFQVDAKTLETNAKTTNSADLFSKAIAEHGTLSSLWPNQASTPWDKSKLTPVFSTENEETEVVGDFKPVIPLPELIEVKTGEEEEIAIFSERAKLYRYDAPTTQWKERGVGEFKILKHNINERYRLVLRRDQVLKIACNHYISKDLEFSHMPSSEKSVCWYAVDYSESVGTSEQFAVKFKNKTLVDNFLKKVDEVKKSCV